MFSKLCDVVNGNIIIKIKCVQDTKYRSLLFWIIYCGFCFHELGELVDSHMGGRTPSSTKVGFSLHNIGLAYDKGRSLD